MQADSRSTDVAIVGAGSIGVAVAYYLKQLNPALAVLLLDNAAPLSLTSAASGENYRNWWPHPVMKSFMDRSLDLLDEIAASGASVVHNRAGYLLATRQTDPAELLQSLSVTYPDANALRHHDKASSYCRALDKTQDGCDLLTGNGEIKKAYPGFSDEIRHLVHIRRGGTLDAQQLGQTMLQRFREQGGVRMTAEVKGIEHNGQFTLHLDTGGAGSTVVADQLVNAAGPFSDRVSDWLGVTLPVSHVLQQKIAFEDTAGVVPRQLPFAIDLDTADLDWNTEERAALAEDQRAARFLENMPGAIHCRPEGGLHSRWIKLGWAYNNNEADATTREPPLDAEFPEIVLRGAARLQPALKRYYEGFPGGFTHYGGYYTLTEENWPLLGDTPVPGYLIATAMSGFGSMAACGAGELLARRIITGHADTLGRQLSLQRYADASLMQELRELNNRGIL